MQFVVRWPTFRQHQAWTETQSPERDRERQTKMKFKSKNKMPTRDDARHADSPRGRTDAPRRVTIDRSFSPPSADLHPSAYRFPNLVCRA